MSRKGFRQKGGAARLNCLFPDCCRINRGHENDRNLRAPRSQPTPHFDTGYAAQVNIENDTSHIVCCIALQKSLSRAESFCRKVMGNQQTRKSPHDAWFVVNDRDHLFGCGQFTGAINLVRRRKYKPLKDLLAECRVGKYCPLVQYGERLLNCRRTSF